MLIIKQFAVHKCGHEKNPISASDCLYSLLRQSRDEHYFLATQDPDLTELVRQLTYVPLIYIKMNTIVMEKPVEKAKDVAVKLQEESLKVEARQFQTLNKLKQIELGESNETTRKRKRKGPKEPNPLSCKKKKNQPVKTPEDGTESSNRKRRKRSKRIPNHIKRMFNKIESELNVQ